MSDPDPKVEKVAGRYEIDLSRCIFCGFCVDACPEEAIAMTREYDLATTNRHSNLQYGIEALTQREEIAAYGAGYRPHMQYPLVESYLPTEHPPRFLNSPARDDKHHHDSQDKTENHE